MADEGDAYDPMKDPLRKPRKPTDPGWKYGYMQTPGNTNIVVCNLCGKVTQGGIKRQKEHLAGTGGDAKGCPKASTEIRKEMLVYLATHRRITGQPDDDDDVVVVDAQGEVEISTTRQSSGTKAKQARRAFTVDASSECQDAEMIADLLEKKIDEVGREHVVQVVTDNGANYKKAGKILMDRIPTLYWSPCACHCLDLMLEDIGKLQAFKKPIARGRRVTNFIYRHGRILSLMRKATGGLDLVRPAATRFATSFLALKSLVMHKQALRSLFTSHKWVANKLAKTAAGQNVQDIVLSADWWHSIEDCLRASGPLLRVLRLADGDEVPAMPEITAVMRLAKEKINQSFPQQNKKALLKKVMGIIDKRWENQMDHPLYGAALYLNPGKYFPIKDSGDDALAGELRSCFNDVLAKMVLDVEIRNKIDAQSVLYAGRRGTFSNVMAIQNMAIQNPIDWWQSYGGRAIDLQRFALRIVSLCASSSGCERNWSAFEFIHTKKRNRLQHSVLNDNVFVSYNRKNMDRFQKRREKKGDKSYDPLVIEDFDWGNDWVDPTLPPPQGARGCPDDIDWDAVDEAVGASSSLQGRNLRRGGTGTGTMGRGPSNVNTHYERQRKRAATIDLEDLTNDIEEHTSNPNGEDDDSEFEDDIDVTDDEDDPNAEQDDEDGIDATMNEFDDGFV